MRAAPLFLTTAMAVTPAHAANEFDNAAMFIEAYAHSDNLNFRFYIRGIGDGIAIYNSALQIRKKIPASGL